LVCPKCAAENKDAAKFCNQCGTLLAARCPDCATPHRPGQRFCEECGRALSASSEAIVTAGPSNGARTDQPAGQAAEMRLVSVLFVDLVDFTSIAELREAEDVRELLGRYFDSARTIVERYGGLVEKFIGDAVMAVWGAPVAREDDAERAVRAALDMVDAVGALGAEVGEAGLRARAGVATGQAATMESPGEGLVVGDRVNSASRIQSSAAPGTVLVDEVTRQATAAAIAYEDAGDHVVKGKSQPLHLWRAVRVVAGVGGSDRAQGLEAVFVDRDAELRLLKELFHGALDRGTAKLVAVSGEAGVGKSRLRHEFFNYLDGLSGTILWHMGRCLSHGNGVAYWALAEMLRQRFGIAEDAGVEEAARKLDEGLERWVPDQGDREFMRPRLGALLGVAQPGLAREELFAGWRLFFEQLAAQLPIVLVFEDLQWADAELLDFVEQLLDWSASSPIFILTLARPELAAGREGWPAGRRGATVLPLEPLGEREMHSLLNSLVSELPAEAVERIVAQAVGMPLYALETVRALVSRGALTEEPDGRLVPSGEIGELDVPASLSSLLAARIDTLEPAERELVKAMSVFGGSFPRSAAAALAGLPGDGLDPVLTSLVRKHVLAVRADRLSPDRGQYAFAQSLLRTVAYGLLSRQERKPRHLAAAEHLRKAFPNDGEEVAEVIASHCLEAYRAARDDPDAAQLREQTAQALQRSAKRADTVGAPEAAERAYLSAMELTSDAPARARLTEAAAEMAARSGRREQAIMLFETAAAAYRSAGREREAARTVVGVSRLLVRIGRIREAIERITAALEVLATDRLDADVAALNMMLGYALWMSSENDRAGPPLERAVKAAQALELPAVLAEAISLKASVCAYSNSPQEARYLYAGAIDLAERNGLGDVLAVAQANLGNIAMFWDLPEAEASLRDALTLTRRRGDRYGESVAGSNLMQVQLFAGAWGEVERLGDELLGDDEQRDAGDMIVAVLTALWSLRGQVEAARSQLARLEAWDVSENEERLAEGAVARLYVLVAERSSEQALELGTRTLARSVDRLGAAHESVRHAWPPTVDIALALGRFDDAGELIALLADRPPGHVPPYLRAQLTRGRALLAIAQDRHDEVQADLLEAIDRLRELSYPYWLAVAQTDLAEWLLSAGRADEAAPLLEEAQAKLESLGAAPALERARRLSGFAAGAAVS
jgi:class 3 adenylate cyclase